MLSQTWDKIVEFRNIVGGEGTFSIAGFIGCMAKLDDEGWSFVECSVSWMIEVDDWVCSGSSDAFWTEAVCSEALCSGTLCSVGDCSKTLSSRTSISKVGTKLFVVDVRGFLS